jgi:hypothetical protein
VKLKIGLLILILGAIATFFLFGTAEAANTGTVSPSVTVGTTLSLIIENPENVQWGGKSAGTTQTGIIQAQIGANTNWSLTVQATNGYPSTNELTDGNHKISSSYFKYTSAAGSPTPAGQGTSSATAFDGSNQTSVWTEGTAIADCRVAITYNLQIPAGQSPGTYTATHTYTLASS